MGVNKNWLSRVNSEDRIPGTYPLNLNQGGQKKKGCVQLDWPSLTGAVCSVDKFVTFFWYIF